MAKITAKQIENLRVAYSIMAGYPAHRISLSIVRTYKAEDRDIRSRHCHSAGCVAGILSAHPYFIAQGLQWNGWEVRLGKNHIFQASEKLFGNVRIFLGGPSGIEGKREALMRIRLALLADNAITVDRSVELTRYERAMNN